jgi:hypothetical protein
VQRETAAIAELFAAAAHEPEDPGTALVLADALLELGDVRGELPQVQRALSARPKGERAELLGREQALLRATRDRLVGARLGTLPGVAVEARFGFVRRLVLENLTREQLTAALESALGSPDGRLLAEIEIGSDDDEVMGIGDVFAGLAGEVQPPSALRRLRIGNAFERDSGDRQGTIGEDDVDEDGMPYSEVEYEDLREVLTVVPQLRELEIDLGAIQARLPVLASNKLERLTWISPRITRDALAPLAGAVLPALTRFEIWLGGAYEMIIDEDDDGDGEVRCTESLGISDLRPTLAMLDRCTALRELVVAHYEEVWLLARELRRHPLLPRLQRLGFPRADLGESDADEIVELMTFAPNITRLDIDESTCESRIHASLRRRLGTRLVGEPASEPTQFRFIAAGE